MYKTIAKLIMKAYFIKEKKYFKIFKHNSKI